jgi:hypothetical protein
MPMKLSDALFATAELCGTKLSEIAAELMLTDLSAYPAKDVQQALSRCRRELKGRLTIAEIVSRIADGRPGPDEAWGMLVWDEELTGVLTAEMELAQGVAWKLWHANDKVGARMAFRDQYTRLITEAREQRKPVEWRVSLGWDKSARIGPVTEAVQQCRISADAARRFLPEGVQITPDGKLLESNMSDRTRKILEPFRQ